jgi:transposase
LGVTNRRADRIKVLVYDGLGVWLAARRLNNGKFLWPKDTTATGAPGRAQFDALVLGLPWQRIGDAGVIRLLQLAQFSSLPMCRIRRDGRDHEQ